MPGRVDGRVAVVTGGAQGIGAVYAKTLAAEGAKVAIADLLDGDPVVKTIAQAGGDAMSVTTDVTDEASVNAMVKATVKRFGRLDILVANAAIFTTLKLKPFTEISAEEWDKVMAVNVRGLFLCAKAAVPEMRRNKWGRIINISSGTAFKGTPNFLHYVTSKGAVIAFTRALSREVGGDGICVNTLAPGYVMSEGVIEHQEVWGALAAPVMASRAIKRDQVPEDLTGALLYLASDDCAFMTGQAMVVDGGSANN